MCVCTTTVQRRGAICIIVNNPDDEDSKQYNNLTSCSTDSDDDCSQDDVDIDGDDDYDDDDDTDNDFRTDYDYTIVNNNITNKRLNAHKRKANRKYNKNRKLKSPSTAVVVGADVQVHPRQLNFWQNLLVTQKRRRRQRSAPMKTASQTSTKPNSSKPIAGNRSKRIIDFFRRSSRDIHRKSGEG